MTDEHQEGNESNAPGDSEKKYVGSEWDKRPLRWDDIIIAFFALLGLVGSAVLYKTNSAPPITAFFLATGIASVVYRFLGGIDRAEFAWGTFKVGGTMAALLFIAIYVTREMEPQQPATQSYDGLYDWQYAGDAWKGYVKVEKDGSASVDMIRYMVCAGERKPMKLLQQSGAGKALVDADGATMHVNIPVQFINYDTNCNVTGVAETTILSGDLLRTPAFAGSVAYRSKYGAPLGGMILVKGITP